VRGIGPPERAMSGNNQRDVGIMTGRAGYMVQCWDNMHDPAINHNVVKRREGLIFLSPHMGNDFMMGRVFYESI